MAQRSSDGDMVIYYGKDGKVKDLEPYTKWMGPKLDPGQVVECKCEEGFIHLDCPIHAVPLDADSEGF